MPALRFVNDVREWAAELNSFLRRGLEAHASQPEWDRERQRRGGEQLLALQNRCAMWGRSVVSNCYADGGCITTAAAASRREQTLPAAAAAPLRFEGLCSDPADPAVAAWLIASGVRRVVVGHKPSGDCAAVLSSGHTGVEVLSADNSYGGGKGRGDSLVGLLIRGASPYENHAVVYGTLADGRRHEARLPTLGGQEDGGGGDARIGTRLDDGWWVKARLVGQDGEKDGETLYLCNRGAGRAVEARVVRLPS